MIRLLQHGGIFRAAFYVAGGIVLVALILAVRWSLRPWPPWAPPKGDGKMSRTTTDPTDPRLVHANDETPRPQAEVYLVLSAEERAKGFVRPLRHAYKHKTCGTATMMGQELAETYARNPKFYGGTFCCHCQMHRPVAEFTWDPGTEVVGS